MVNEIDLGLDRIYGEPVGDIVAMWKKIVDIQQGFGKPLAMFWVAGHDEKVALAIDLIADQLGVLRTAVIDFAIGDEELGLRERLGELADKIRAIEGERVLIVARGFERLISLHSDSFWLTRLGHDWDQSVVYDAPNRPWGKLYTDMGKQVVILTTIGFSLGNEIYDEAVKSAVGSDFKQGILELK